MRNTFVQNKLFYNLFSLLFTKVCKKQGMILSVEG